jgi:inorganic pyrophosphatase
MWPEYAVTLVVLLGAGLALLFAILYTKHTAQIAIDPKVQRLLNDDRVQSKIASISETITIGAKAFLFSEYKYMAVFIVVFSIILLLLLGFLHDWSNAVFTVISFVLGSVTSILAGYIGMLIAVFANSRTAVKANEGYGPAFVTAFKAGCVMGFALIGLGLLNLFILITLINLYYDDAYDNFENTKSMYEAIAGYGLGGSSIALFGRVGGGIYTKAADVGADLCKIDFDLNEDCPQNPAVIADNVGDNVGDIAGMGADLFGSFAESSCAAMVISSQSPELFKYSQAMYLPLVIAAVGIMVCIVTSFLATHIRPVQVKADIETALKHQLLLSTFLMTPVVYLVCIFFLPDSAFSIGDKTGIKNWHIFFCIAFGLWSGLCIGYVTEYYTSNSYDPVKQVADSCKNGAATNIIYGLALGYKSVIIPVFALAATIYVSYSLAGMYGIANAALGILSTMGIGLTIDAYGPICDNAGGIAEMAGMREEVRERTDALDSAGNTTAAIGKGFAIGSAALVSLALFGAFVTTVGLQSVDILQPFQFAGLLVGAMLPYWFSAMTMKSVGKAALKMGEEVRRQFTEDPNLLAYARAADIEDEKKREEEINRFESMDNCPTPDYNECIKIATNASLEEMIPPGALVMLTPLVVGFLFGVEALAGVLAGSLVSGVQMAISASNTGGAWDNAKKYVEEGSLYINGQKQEKGSAVHKAAVVGDTVGDPLKDTSGPALNILIKLSAIISLVFAPSFPSLSKGGLLHQLFT